MSPYKRTYVVNLTLPSECFSAWGSTVGVRVARRVDKEERKERERGRKEGEKREIRVILTRNHWWERRRRVPALLLQRVSCSARKGFFSPAFIHLNPACVF